MADIANGIVESKILCVCAVCCKWARWALPVADGVWLFVLVVLHLRSWSLSDWYLWHQPPSLLYGRPRPFWILLGQPSRFSWEARRRHSTLGRSQRAFKLDRSVRRPA